MILVIYGAYFLINIEDFQLNKIESNMFLHITTTTCGSVTITCGTVETSRIEHWNFVLHMLHCEETEGFDLIHI